MSTILLNENSNKITHTSGLTIKLKEHQLTSIYAMDQLEQTGSVKRTINSYIHKYRIVEEDSHRYYLPYTRDTNQQLQPINYTIDTNFGILADVVGSGKTYIVLGLINHNLVPNQRDKIISSGIFSCLKYVTSAKPLKTNLIIVPHNLVTQWKQAFAFSKLKTFVIAKRTDVQFLVYPDNIFNNDNKPSKVADTEIINDDEYIFNELNTVEYYDVIICSSTMVDEYVHRFADINYARIIIDEVCSIMLPQDLNLNANFVWFITATPSGIENIRRYYIRDLVSFGRMHKIIFNNIIIKNDDEYVSKSMKLPTLNQVLIRCFTPKHLAIIKEFIPQEVMDMLNAGNTKDAILKLNCNVDTNDNILQVITKKITNDIHNKKAELTYHETIIPRDVDAHNEQLNRLKDKIKSLETKLDSITNRIKEFNKDNCPICCEEFTSVTPAILPCCNQLYCVQCLTQIKGKCPTCRTLFKIQDIHVIMDTGKDPKANNTPSVSEITKIDAVVKIINDKPNGRFLLFSNYDQTFQGLIDKLNENNIKYSKVMGTGAVVNKTIERFKNGEVKVLMLNASNYGSGLNLHMATDVIIYHQLSLELETQVIGRAQRMGRIEPLNVYYLLHSHEISNVTNPTLSLDLSYAADFAQLTEHLQTHNKLNISEHSIENTPAVETTPVASKTAKKVRKVRTVPAIPQDILNDAESRSQQTIIRPSAKLPITRPVSSVVQSVPSIVQSVPSVVQSVQSVVQPVPLVVQSVPSVVQPVSSVVAQRKKTVKRTI